MFGSAHCHDHTELQKYTILLVLATMKPCLSCIIAAYNNTCCLRNRAGRSEPPLNLIQNPQTHNNPLPQAQIGSISAPLTGRDHQTDSGDQLELSKHLWPWFPTCPCETVPGLYGLLFPRHALLSTTRVSDKKGKLLLTLPVGKSTRGTGMRTAWPNSDRSSIQNNPWEER